MVNFSEAFRYLAPLPGDRERVRCRAHEGRWVRLPVHRGSWARGGDLPSGFAGLLRLGCSFFIGRHRERLQGRALGYDAAHVIGAGYPLDLARYVVAHWPPTSQLGVPHALLEEARTVSFQASLMSEETRPTRF